MWLILDSLSYQFSNFRLSFDVPVNVDFHPSRLTFDRKYQPLILNEYILIHKNELGHPSDCKKTYNAS